MPNKMQCYQQDI